MSGALNSVMGGIGGGQGGGLLSSIGGIVGGIFGGPIGSMIGSALGNLVQDAVGEAASNATDRLQKEDGMPPFLAKEIKNMIKEAIGESKNQNVSPEAQHAVNSDHEVQNWKKDFVNELTDKFVENARKYMEQDECNKSGGSEGGKTGGKKSWLQALAEGMGKTLGDKAAKMVELSKKMSDLSAAKEGGTGGAGGADADKEAQQNAKAFTTAQTELQGVSQEFSLMQSAFSNALKSIGEGLSQMGRKG